MPREFKLKQLVPFDETKFSRHRFIESMFQRYEEYYRNETYRMIHNQRMYWGINFGQWPAYAVEKLITQGRKPPTFNIIAKKIEGQIGSFLSNGFDMKYITKNGDNAEWGLHLYDMSCADRNNLDWETSTVISLRDMHCMVGYERMTISEKYDSDFGNIAWEPLPPNHVYISPSWKSPYASDIENYFEYSMLSVEQICNMYPRIADELKVQREREYIDGINFGEYSAGPSRYKSVEEKWGDWHKVITFHSIVKQERMWEYDLVNRNTFPETGFDAGTEDDKAAKTAYMQKMGLTPDDVTQVRQIKKIKRIEAICPTLNSELFFASGKDRVQTNNCNIYPLGNNFYGQFRGVVDDLEDTQVNFNKAKMTIEDVMMRTAKGAVILDSALTGGDDRVREQIESQWNNPAARIWVDEGSTLELGPHGGIVELPAHPPTPDMFQQTTQTLELADWLSTMPAAMDSRTESSSESGKLYQSKVQVGLISQKYGMKIWERHEREKAQAYILQAKITYAGYPREFKKIGKGDSLILNQPGIDVSGRRVILNDISVMPEMTVISTPSPSGINLRTELRSQFTETLNILQDPNDRLLKLICLKNVFNTQDMPQDDREEVKKACELLITVTAMGLAMQAQQLKAQMAQMGTPQQQPDQQQQQITDGSFDKSKAIQGTPQEQLQPAGGANG